MTETVEEKQSWASRPRSPKREDAYRRVMDRALSIARVKADAAEHNAERTAEIVPSDDTIPRDQENQDRETYWAGRKDEEQAKWISLARLAAWQDKMAASCKTGRDALETQGLAGMPTYWRERNTQNGLERLKRNLWQDHAKEFGTGPGNEPTRVR